MDRIEELLTELCNEQQQFTRFSNLQPQAHAHKVRRDALRQQIADEWREMVEGLERAEQTLRNLLGWIEGDGSIIIENEAANIRATLSRTRG